MARFFTISRHNCAYLPAGLRLVATEVRSSLIPNPPWSSELAQNLSNPYLVQQQFFFDSFQGVPPSLVGRFPLLLDAAQLLLEYRIGNRMFRSEVRRFDVPGGLDKDFVGALVSEKR